MYLLNSCRQCTMQVKEGWTLGPHEFIGSLVRRDFRKAPMARVVLGGTAAARASPCLKTYDQTTSENSL